MSALLPLPGGAWRALFPRALTIMDDIRRHGGLSRPFWTLGGGTVLMFRHRHRLNQIRRPNRALLNGFDAIVALDYHPSYPHCATLAEAFLSGL